MPFGIGQSFMPGEWDPMGGTAGGPIGGMMNRGPKWLPQGGGFGGVLGGDPQAQQGGLMGLLGRPEVQDFALSLLANSGYSPNKRSFGEILGTSALQSRQFGQQRGDDAFKRQYMQAQMDAMGQKQQGPSSVQEYEYAKKNGYPGSFQEWTVAAGQSSRPSSVLEWEHYNGLLEGDKKNRTNNAQLYLEMKRNPNFKITDVNKAPTAVIGTPGGGFTATPLSTTSSEAAAAGEIKGAEAQAGAIGAGQGGIVAGIKKKGADAKTVMSTLDLADSLIDKATGSGFGAIADRGASFVGKATEGAQATAQLQVLQVGLMLNMPRMEGPQSDRDVELYRQAAASLGDPTVPRETKKAAVQTIRKIQQQYADRAKQPFQIQPSAAQPTLDDIRKKYGR